MAKNGFSGRMKLKEKAFAPCGGCASDTLPWTRRGRYAAQASPVGISVWSPAAFRLVRFPQPPRGGGRVGRSHAEAVRHAPLLHHGGRHAHDPPPIPATRAGLQGGANPPTAPAGQTKHICGQGHFGESYQKLEIFWGKIPYNTLKRPKQPFKKIAVAEFSPSKEEEEGAKSAQKNEPLQGRKFGTGTLSIHPKLSFIFFKPTFLNFAPQELVRKALLAVTKPLHVRPGAGISVWVGSGSLKKPRKMSVIRNCCVPCVPILSGGDRLRHVRRATVFFFKNCSLHKHVPVYQCTVSFSW